VGSPDAYTVVLEDQVEERLKQLTAKGSEWRFFSKLALFEGDNIERLIAFVRDAEPGER